MSSLSQLACRSSKLDLRPHSGYIGSGTTCTYGGGGGGGGGGGNRVMGGGRRDITVTCGCIF